MSSEPRDRSELGGGSYSIDAKDCIRCAACSSLAPGVFVVADDGSRVARQPGTVDEERLAAAALLVCPTAAVKRRVDRG